MSTAIFYSEEFLKHNPGLNHPERPERLKVIVREIRRAGFLSSGKCVMLNPRKASKNDLFLVHKRDYVELVKKYCELGGGLLDLGDTIVSKESFESAVYAVGASIQAVDLIVNGCYKYVFALVRPPGHHAGPSYACGFCIFNNVALAAKHLIERRNLNRILIVDLDAHHGNGTQEIFYDTNKVLYMSIHQNPMGFPGTGFEDEVGSGEGLGYTVNIPLPYRAGDETYLKAVEQIVTPIVEDYKPQITLVSIGFDVHYTDPIARLSLTAYGQLEALKKILSLVGKAAFILEGGYSLNFIGRMAAADIAFMAGLEYELRDKRVQSPNSVRARAESIIREVKRIQSKFWSL